MRRKNLYDRLHENRVAAEQRAQEQAKQAAEEHSLECQRAAQADARLQLKPGNNALKIAGLDLLLPKGFDFSRINFTLECNGSPVTVTARRRPAPEGSLLADEISVQITRLIALHPDFTLIRQSTCLLAGHAAQSLDYWFREGEGARHGRTLLALIEAPNAIQQHWLSFSTVLNPEHDYLGAWLIEFDAMLSAMTAD